jgi:hypothetical protein
MADFSNYAENAICNHFFRNTSTTSPTTVYLALFTAVSDAEAGTGTECAATGYARQAITFGAPSNGVITNSTAVTFGPLTGTIATIVANGIFDSLTSGNALSILKAPTGGNISYSSGDSIQFASSNLTFTVA